VKTFAVKAADFRASRTPKCPNRRRSVSAATKIISGVIGGVAGGQIVTNVLSDPAVAGAFSGVLGDAVGGVAGGGILTAIVGMVMKSMNKA